MGTTSTTTTATMSQEVKQRSGIAAGLNAGQSHSPPAEAESLAHERSPQQEDRIRQGRREGGFRPCTIRAPCDRTAPQQQGQAREEAGEEETRHIRPWQEKGRRDDQGHRRVQEGWPLSLR